MCVRSSYTYNGEKMRLGYTFNGKGTRNEAQLYFCNGEGGRNEARLYFYRGIREEQLCDKCVCFEGWMD